MAVIEYKGWKKAYGSKAGLLAKMHKEEIMINGTKFVLGSKNHTAKEVNAFLAKLVGASWFESGDGKVIDGASATDFLAARKKAGLLSAAVEETVQNAIMSSSDLALAKEKIASIEAEIAVLNQKKKAQARAIETFELLKANLKAEIQAEAEAEAKVKSKKDKAAE